ncbi:MAG TPA: hypothetical protein VFA29_00190, partial [Candidatus Baltobacteraceae bacterium]|nr:hypothetical protein [Candidatus Baltobacteraceae bacterium]
PVQAPIQEPTSTVSDAALTPPTPEPTLSLATTGRIPEWKRPLPISADEINPAAIIIRSKAGKWEPIIVLPVNFDPQWRVYAYRQGTLRMFWWLCILDRRCPEASMAHFEVNGFANAWNLRADASGDLIAVYRPEVEYAAVKSIIVLASVIAAILAAIAAVIARNRRHGEAK